ncbi:hypothetical protein HanIR_Chr04g0175201 [Helianthus annuus]|nr:hypothetical protein HanIR_Chr04g0175201 [Helianthus annuus]
MLKLNRLLLAAILNSFSSGVLVWHAMLVFRLESVSFFEFFLLTISFLSGSEFGASVFRSECFVPSRLPLHES